MKYNISKPYALNYELNNNSYIKEMLRSSEKRAKQKNIDFNLKQSDIIIPLFCPVLGIEIYKGDKIHIDNSPSIDRFNNNLGYISGNINIISNKANAFKNNTSLEDYEKVYVFYKNLFQQTLKG